MSRRRYSQAAQAADDREAAGICRIDAGENREEKGIRRIFKGRTSLCQFPHRKFLHREFPHRKFLYRKFFHKKFLHRESFHKEFLNRGRLEERTAFQAAARGYRRRSAYALFSIHACFCVCLFACLCAGMSIVSPVSVSAQTLGTASCPEKLDPNGREGGMSPQPEEILKYSEPQASAELLQPPAEETEREGVTYHLSEWEIISGEEEAEKQYVETPIIYEKTGARAKIPEEAEISIEGTGLHPSMPLLRTEFFNERWEPDFVFHLTFHSLQADCFELDGTEIEVSYEEENLGLMEYAQEILEFLGLPGEYYRITGFRWDKEAYSDENGTLCRDAEGRGERLVRDCRAVYGGETELPAQVVYRTKAVYTRAGEGREGGQVKGGEEKKPSPQAAQTENQDTVLSLWDRAGKLITVTAAVTVGIGTLAVMLLLLRLVCRACRRLLKRAGKDLSGKDGV